MKLFNQRTLVLCFSFAVTAFLAGGLLVGWQLHSDYQKKLNDNKFLESRLASMQEEESDSGPGKRRSVRVAPAERKKLGSTRYFSGRLVEIQRSILAAEINGPIVAMPVEVGQAVQKDTTVIAEVDTIWSHLAAEQARQRIAVSRVQLGFDQRELDRLQNLSKQGAGYVSESDLDAQRLKLDELRANIVLQEVVLTEAEKRLERSRVVAPFDGVIVNKKSEVGSYVSPGSPLVEIVSTGAIDAELMVGEAFIDRLNVGDVVPIFIESLDLEVEGHIFAIVPLGSTAARSFPVRIRLDDQSGRLKVGMSVRGRLQITDAKDSIVVPKDAVLDRPDGALVWIVTDKKDEQGQPLTPPVPVVQPIQVNITAKTDNEYAILPIASEGRELLQPGVPCVIEGADRLVAAEMVQIVEIDPELLKDLPKASGHTIIEPVE
ncbi:MAG: efflux RND transporter periplasmic adaptor subunit [Planctomycetia bacterium]|nr:efflux RND transporter periplasmic adaptor subunit [Planctomycetia bacterium]